MILLICFVLVMAGCVNWLLIGLLQFDFVAGIFGWQGSVFSRIIYILIGAAALFFLFKIIAMKGNLELFNLKKNRLKKAKKEDGVRAERYDERRLPPNVENGSYRRLHNVETGREEFYRHGDYGENTFDRNWEKKTHDSLFDEYFSDED